MLSFETSLALCSSFECFTAIWAMLRKSLLVPRLLSLGNFDRNLSSKCSQYCRTFQFWDQCFWFCLSQPANIRPWEHQGEIGVFQQCACEFFSFRFSVKAAFFPQESFFQPIFGFATSVHRSFEESPCCGSKGFIAHFVQTFSYCPLSASPVRGKSANSQALLYHPASRVTFAFWLLEILFSSSSSANALVQGSQ